MIQIIRAMLDYINFRRESNNTHQHSFLESYKSSLDILLVWVDVDGLES